MLSSLTNDLLHIVLLECTCQGLVEEMEADFFFMELPLSFMSLRTFDTIPELHIFLCMSYFSNL